MNLERDGIRLFPSLAHLCHCNRKIQNKKQGYPVLSKEKQITHMEQRSLEEVKNILSQRKIARRCWAGGAGIETQCSLHLQSPSQAGSKLRCVFVGM